MEREAMHYEKCGEHIKCLLCPKCCIIKEGNTGFCNVREVKDGELYTRNYGIVTSIALDPMEKKPLYHFKPGKKILSFGSFGCNFRCGFCQNYSISQTKAEGTYITPQRLSEIITDYKSYGTVGVAFTYNEPSIWFEYIYDAFNYIDEKEDIVLVTNGYIKKEPLNMLLQRVRAMNIDLKSFREDFYRDICYGTLSDVLDTIKISSKKCHVEITTLLIEGYNDSQEELEELFKFISSVDSDIPLHITRYFPNYCFKNPPTSIDKLKDARDLAYKYLNYVYIGNIMGFDNNTYCKKCKSLLIKREGRVCINLTKDGNCPVCGQSNNIIL